MNNKFRACRTHLVFIILYQMYICKYFYGQFFLSIWNIFSLDVTLLYYYFGDHKVVLILLWDLFLNVLSQN
jgi:hypothetical protein